MLSKIQKLAIIFSLLALSSCQSLKSSKIPFFDKGPAAQEENILEESLEAGEEFGVVENEAQIEKINEQIQEEIEQVEVPDRVLFGLNQSDLSDTAKEKLNIQIEWLKSDNSINVIIEGHADERGTREYNIALGEKRATSVKNYFINNGGIDANRIKTISYGKERPAFIGTGEEIWGKNRRAVTAIEE